MSSNYPAGSMVGSGIYTTSTTLDVECGETWDDPIDIVGACTFSGRVDVTVDDRGLTGFWTCPDCSADHEEEMDQFAPDPDEAYDRMRDERDGIY